jgi:sulfur carrier protein ThiS
MKVEINLYATLARFLPQQVIENNRKVDVRDGSTIAELLKELNVPEKQVKLIFLDGVRANKDDVLREGSRVGVFPPVGGG